MFGVGAYNVTQSGTQLALFSLASTVTAFGRVTCTQRLALYGHRAILVEDPSHVAPCGPSAFASSPLPEFASAALELRAIFPMICAKQIGM